MLKLIMVDDESGVREQIRNLIRWEDFDIEIIGSCENSLSALQIAIDERPDVFLTDIKMPVMDGIELCGKILKMYPAVQCILLSGYSEFSLAQNAMRQGIRHYLLKPCSKNEIEQVLEQCRQQIQLESAGTLYRYDKRKQLVHRIADDLLRLQGDGSDAVQPAQVEDLVRFYLDISLLQEALMLIVAQRASVLNPREALARIAGAFYEEKQLFAYTAEVLSDIFQKTAGASIVTEVKAYIDTHYNNPNLTLQYIADQVVHMNAQYLGKSFLKEVGMKFSEYAMSVRMEEAMKLLKKTHGNRMYEIADEIGLGDNVQYFYHLFKKYTGMTPREYQQAHS